MWVLKYYAVIELVEMTDSALLPTLRTPFCLARPPKEDTVCLNSDLARAPKLYHSNTVIPVKFAWLFFKKA